MFLKDKRSSLFFGKKVFISLLQVRALVLIKFFNGFIRCFDGATTFNQTTLSLTTLSMHSV
jgi:hypothetical protein